jgi:hypothetical protein
MLVCSNRAVQAMLCDTIDACTALPVALWQLQQAHPQRSTASRQWFIVQAHDRVLPIAGSEQPDSTSIRGDTSCVLAIGSSLL